MGRSSHETIEKQRTYARARAVRHSLLIQITQIFVTIPFFIHVNLPACRQRDGGEVDIRHVIFSDDFSQTFPGSSLILPVTVIVSHSMAHPRKSSGSFIVNFALRSILNESYRAELSVDPRPSSLYRLRRIMPPASPGKCRRSSIMKVPEFPSLRKP